MKLFLAIVFGLVLTNAFAQQEPPKGFKKGYIVLDDSSQLQGYVKDYFSGGASLVFINETSTKKKEYKGQNLLAAEIDGTKFICFHGDFFKIIADGELLLVQKATDASSLPSYNGTEAIFINGTEGRKNDYFIYKPKRRELKLISKKNFKDLAESVFNGYAPAIAMTEGNNAELSQLKKAVELYNSRPIKQ